MKSKKAMGKQELVKAINAIRPGTANMRMNLDVLEEMHHGATEFAEAMANGATEIVSAVWSNYSLQSGERLILMLSREEKLYFGVDELYKRSARHFAAAYYIGEPIPIPEESDMYSMLWGEGCVLPQGEAISQGIYTVEKLRRFEELRRNFLSQFECNQEFLFDGKPLDT